MGWLSVLHRRGGGAALAAARHAAVSWLLAHTATAETPLPSAPPTSPTAVRRLLLKWQASPLLVHASTHVASRRSVAHRCTNRHLNSYASGNVVATTDGDVAKSHHSEVTFALGTTLTLLLERPQRTFLERSPTPSAPLVVDASPTADDELAAASRSLAATPPHPDGGDGIEAQSSGPNRSSIAEFGIDVDDDLNLVDLTTRSSQAAFQLAAGLHWTDESIRTAKTAIAFEVRSVSGTPIRDASDLCQLLSDPRLTAISLVLRVVSRKNGLPSDPTPPSPSDTVGLWDGDGELDLGSRSHSAAPNPNRGSWRSLVRQTQPRAPPMLAAQNNGPLHGEDFYAAELLPPRPPSGPFATPPLPSLRGSPKALSRVTDTASSPPADGRRVSTDAPLRMAPVAPFSTGDAVAASRQYSTYANPRESPRRASTHEELNAPVATIHCKVGTVALHESIDDVAKDAHTPPSSWLVTSIEAAMRRLLTAAASILRSSSHQPMDAAFVSISISIDARTLVALTQSSDDGRLHDAFAAPAASGDYRAAAPPPPLTDRAARAPGSAPPPPQQSQLRHSAKTPLYYQSSSVELEPSTEGPVPHPRNDDHDHALQPADGATVASHGGVGRAPRPRGHNSSGRVDGSNAGAEPPMSYGSYLSPPPRHFAFTPGAESPPPFGESLLPPRATSVSLSRHSAPAASHGTAATTHGRNARPHGGGGGGGGVPNGVTKLPKHLFTRIREFEASDSASELVFPDSLSSKERLAVHTFAAASQGRVRSESHGDGTRRHVVLIKVGRAANRDTTPHAVAPSAGGDDSGGGNAAIDGGSTAAGRENGDAGGVRSAAEDQMAPAAAPGGRSRRSVDAQVPRTALHPTLPSTSSMMASSFFNPDIVLPTAAAPESDVSVSSHVATSSSAELSAPTAKAGEVPIGSVDNKPTLETREIHDRAP